MDRLARELTAVTGESLTTAVEMALRERLERARSSNRSVRILTGEPGVGWLERALAQAERAVMPAASYVELGIVIESRLGPAVTGQAARFVRDAEVIDVPPRMAGLAAVRQGAASGEAELWRLHRLRHRGEPEAPVRCVGDDFGRTEVVVLQPPTH